MEWLTGPLAQFITWMFDNTLVLLGNAPNVMFIVLGFVGLFLTRKNRMRFVRQSKRDVPVDL